MINPYNDHVLVELPKQQFTTANTDADGQDDPNADYGVVVSIPKAEDVLYISSYSWMSDASLNNQEFHITMHKAMKALQGKTVYFEKRGAIGNTIEDGDTKYATIKLSKITAVVND